MFTVIEDFGINLDEVLITVPADSTLGKQLIEEAEPKNNVINCCRGRKRQTVALLKDKTTILILPVKTGQLAK